MCKICDWWSACISFIIDCKIDNACTQYTKQIITNINLHSTISEYIIKSNNRNILYDNDKKKRWQMRYIITHMIVNLSIS